MKDSRWILILAMAVFVAACAGMARVAEEPEAAAAFAVSQEENLFAPPEEDGFSIEVVGMEEKTRKRVLIYHTHTYEAFAQVEDAPYAETEKWRSADSRYNMVRVGEELAALLESMDVEVVHDTTAFEPPVLSSAYARSMDMLRARQAAGEVYDLCIDLHRDAYIEGQKGPNTVDLGGEKAARLMMLIGNGKGFDEKPDWERNLAFAQAITAALNQQCEGLGREVAVKTGRYNQHAASVCILIEAGNNRNTLEEVLCAMPALADAICQALGV